LRALEAIAFRTSFYDETTSGLLAGHATADESKDVRADAVVLLRVRCVTRPDARILVTLKNPARFDPSRRVKRSVSEALRDHYAVETSGDDSPEELDHPGDLDEESYRGS
jgi:hypothetical protein